jgi:alcohol dehydrogenase (cytochrome c)
MGFDFSTQRSASTAAQPRRVRSRVTGLILSWFVLLLWLIVGLGEEARADGVAPRADDWITINKDYSSQRFVDLDQITPQNAGKLKEVCEIQLNENSLFSTGLLKVGRTLYVTLSRLTYAIDAATCDLRWLHPITYQTTPITGNNRGSAYLDGAIFRGTPDGYVIALDANTGEPLPTWPQNGVLAADINNHETFLSAPIAWQGKVVIGIGISDNGIAGRLMAFDAKTGKELWSFQTTFPDPQLVSQPKLAAACGRATRWIPIPARCLPGLPTPFRTLIGVGIPRALSLLPIRSFP